jgi:hypothetical protein
MPQLNKRKPWRMLSLGMAALLAISGVQKFHHADFLVELIFGNRSTLIGHDNLAVVFRLIIEGGTAKCHN